ncbi:flagellar hook-basal body complex protein [Helicobacter zhangjianzhongii]|uniref:Flagellar hook-basal body complex protein n=1 Tax=Helicobacter zhangjianzhongii TaxID=2974574 RepID=A0ACC6FTQ1_9HELI|nr:MULTISPECIES: flagellar hook-basal body complex protein [unclassified Helicobacter]MDL0080815.1 flagellar hook-basal body complex protein [Helicobacter sp. CPD2-1]MDL0082659.1 flagellar hook-basal body complex protein [Helicobacter sp. XJK30-2]
MAMNDTILNSYSGMKTHQFGLDSISNNIANVNTNGFKENIPEFKNLFSAQMDTLNSSTITNNDRSYGATGASNAISTKNGNYHPSDGQFDVAYMGKGWFVVGEKQDGSFEVKEDGYEMPQPIYFTRNGGFNRDSDGYLVTSSGQYVYGVNLDKIKDGVFTSNPSEQDLSSLPTGQMHPLQIPQELKFHPVVTTKVDVAVNLNAKSNFKSAQEFLVPNGVIDESRVKSQDVASFADDDGQPFDPRAFRDIIITIKKGEEGSESEETLRFSYGSGGASANEFRTIGELMELFSKSGLELSPTLGARGNLAFSVKNPQAQKLEVTIGGALSNRIGISTSAIPLAQDEHIQSKDLKIATYSTSLDIYDEDGGKFLLKSEYYLMDAGDPTGTPPIPQRWLVQSAVYDFSGEFMISKEPVTQELVFDKDGKPESAPMELDFKDSKITYSITGSDKYTSRNLPYEDSKMLEASQDGKAEGSLKDIRIDENGIIFLAFSNGVSEPMGRLGVVAFVNDQGLKKMGDNVYSLGTNALGGQNRVLSGNPILGWNNEGNLKFGQIKHKYLETSNVDVGNALTNLILYQRGYSMNAKAFNTGDDLVKEAIALKK